MRQAIEKTYAESSIEQTQAASTAYAQEITRRFDAARALVKEAAGNLVEAANESRMIGMELQAWMDKLQMKFENFEKFFHDNAALLPKKLTSARAKYFLKAWRAYPEKIPKTDAGLVDAIFILEQMTLPGLGMKEESTRLLAQTAQTLSPLEKIVSIWGKQSEELQRFREQVPEEKWDRNVWQTVVDATRDPADLHRRGLVYLNGNGDSPHSRE